MTAAAPPSGAKRWLIIVTVMAATFMQVLDTTIANVALPHMQAALGANPESVVWVLTSYIIMSAIATPITGWLEGRFGRRNLFAVAIAGFTASSAACGFAGTLEMMVAARALQGVFGAFIVPLGQSTMLDSSTPQKQPQALMIFTMGVTLGPITGPVLGGWLTDNYDWRWVFFINVPVGIIATVGVLLLLDKGERIKRRFDILGFVLLSLMLAGLQLMLDRGAQKDWFESTEIWIEAGVAVAALWMFGVHILTAKAPLLPLGLLRDRNFTLAMLFTMLVMGVAIGGPALLATMLQVLMGYDTMGAGTMMMPRGVGALIAMPIATYFSRRIDPRIVIGTGIALIGTSLWIMTGFNLEMGKNWLVYSAVMQGMGMGMTFLPLTILAFSTLPPHLRTDGASFNALARSLGGSVTLSILGALLARNVQVNHAELGERFTTVNAGLLNGGVIGPVAIPGGFGAQLVDAEINRQAMMIAYIDDFWTMMWMAFAALPLVILLRPRKQGAGGPPLPIAE